MDKKTRNDIRSKLSTLQLERYIIDIAEAYKSVPNIYFPVRLDQRTRLYCQTDFFNYQSNDLAKALLSFSESGKILKQDTEAINYFKSYGAILFDKELSNKSINQRVEWVDQHQDYILNF